MAIILDVKKLTKNFKGFKAIEDISFQVMEGEIFGLLGPNGAGKTTTIRVIATILTPTGGTAEIAGFDIIKNSEEARKNIRFTRGYRFGKRERRIRTRVFTAVFNCYLGDNRRTIYGA